MAKENLVLLHGQVVGTPKIFINSEGQKVKAAFLVKTLRRASLGSPVSLSKLMIDTPVLWTKNLELIDTVSTLSTGDMVDVRGVITTKELLKTTTCKCCGAKNSVEGNAVYITPIYICRREQGLTGEQGLQLLKARNEVSNLSMLIGTLCREVQSYRDELNRDYCQYQLAVNRKFRIKEDSAEIKTDYPWVKTFGAQAYEDSKALRTGSVVYINGAIQTRNVERTTTCIHCGTTYLWKDSAMEVVPYSIEYLSNVKIKENENESDGQTQKPIGSTESRTSGDD